MGEVDVEKEKYGKKKRDWNRNWKVENVRENENKVERVGDERERIKKTREREEKKRKWLVFWVWVCGAVLIEIICLGLVFGFFKFVFRVKYYF